MEDYIYILIALLWIVFSVIKANKKKNAAVPDEVDEYDEFEESSQEQRSTFDELLEEFLGEESSTKTRSKPAQTEPQQTVESIFDRDQPKTLTPEIEEKEDIASEIDEDPLEPIYIMEGDEPITGQSLTQKTDTDDYDTSRIRAMQKKQFDLRKAVIYSSILHRPYA